MNRNELVADIVNRTGLKKKDAVIFAEAYEQSILDAIGRGDNVFLHGFMKIERKTQKARSGYDFKNSRPMVVKECERVTIRPGSLLIDCLNKDGG